MILVDTSVWIDYLRQGEPLLAEKLGQGQILMHEMVLGELATGTFKNRRLLLRRWKVLPMVTTTAAQALGLEYEMAAEVGHPIRGSVAEINAESLRELDQQLRRIAGHQLNCV